MMLNIRKSFLFVLMIYSTQSIGQTLTLQQILQEIEKNNPSLKAYENQIKSSDAKVAGAGAWMAPMIGAGRFMAPYPGETVTHDTDKGAFMISAEQDIPNPLKIKARKEYLKTQSLTPFYEKTLRFNDLRATARQTYFDLLIAYKKIHYQQENQRIMQNMKKLAEIRYPLNKGNLNEIFKAEGRAHEAENMILMTNGDIRSKKIVLNTLMNRPADSELKIDTTISVSFNPIANLDTTYLSDTRSDILHMQHDIHAMKANIKQMRKEAMPDFRIRFDHMSNYADMMPRQFTLMGMLSVPFAPWSSKMYKSQVKSMNFEIAAMQQQKEAMLTEVLGMTRGMENNILTMQKQLGNYDSKILPALNKNLKVSMLSYQENKGDLTAVIDAWETVNMAQINYLDQLQKFYQMIVEYEKNIER